MIYFSILSILVIYLHHQLFPSADPAEDLSPRSPDFSVNTTASSSSSDSTLFRLPEFLQIVTNYTKAFPFVSIPVDSPITIYKIPIFSRAVLSLVYDFLLDLLLLFPLFFAFGLLPQPSSFIMFVTEQIELHIFGGSGLINMAAVLFCLIKAGLALGILWPLSFVALKVLLNFLLLKFFIEIAVAIKLCTKN